MGAKVPLDDLRARIAGIERRGAGGTRGAAALAFGVAAIDGALPGGGGLAGAALHEAAGAGDEAEHGAAAALVVAGLLARAPGPVLWVSGRFDLFAPALAAAGLGPRRVLHVEAGPDVLPAMEEGLRHRGLAGVVGEVTGRLGLTASRRLQLAAEASGAAAFAIRRARRRDRLAAMLDEPTAAATRWRVACLPSPPPLPHAPDTPGLGRARWRLDLVRCRGGEPGSWILEACDAQGRFRLAADLGHGQAAPGRRGGRAAAAAAAG